MKLFNIDCHVSVIEDIRRCLAPLGHEVTDWSLSAHCHRFDKKPTAVDVIGDGRWKQIDQAMCDRFYETYKGLLKHYDGFIAAYPPAFALLYEKFQKPVITVVATRYDYPCTPSAERWAWLNGKLTQGIRDGWIIPLANNLFDKWYCEAFMPFTKWEHVPSLCDYVKVRHCPRCNRHRRFRVYGRQRYWAGIGTSMEQNAEFGIRSPLIDRGFRLDAPGPEPTMLQHHIETGRSTAAIHLPYNLSVMSIFEQYAMGLPILVPSLALMRRWYGIGIKDRMNPLPVLDQLFFDKGIPYVHGLKEEEQFKLADFYDNENMPHIIPFDSVAQIDRILCEGLDFFELTSNAMRAAFDKKKARVLAQWESIMRRLK